jgi:hypothetical protein
MRYLLLLLICLSSSAHAGIFGASTYAECVDEVVKSAKIKEALYEGQSNCYEKYVRPKQDKMQNKAWQSNFRSATQIEISQLRCRRQGKYQNYYFIDCTFSDLPMSNYAILKLNVTLKDGSSKDIEFTNYAPDLKWKDGALTGQSEVEVEKINSKTLRVKDTK